MISSDNLAFLGAPCPRDGWPIGLTSRPVTSAPATQPRPPLGDSAPAPPASGDSGPASALPAPPGRAGISICILPSKTIRFHLHMGVVKAPLCNLGLSVSRLTDVIETPCKGKPIATDTLDRNR